MHKVLNLRLKGFDKVASLSVKGPEKPTLVERVVDLFPVPYWLGALILSAMIGVPGMLLGRYIDTRNINTTLSLFGKNFGWQNVVTFSLANFVMPFYALIGIAYMRSKIVGTEPHLAVLAPDGKKTLKRVFESVSRLWPAIILAIPLAAVSLVSFPGQSEHIAGPLSSVVKVVGFSFAILSYGTFVWVYISSIRGLYNLGKEPLKLVSYYEDLHLGLKPFGSLSLRLTLVYFVGIGLVFLSFLSVPTILDIALLVLIALGVIMFFLPLRTLHHKMCEEKRLAHKALNKHFKIIADILDRPSKNIQLTMKDIRNLFALEIAERRVSGISEWPFYLSQLRWLSAFALAIGTTVITRYVLSFLTL